MNKCIIVKGQQFAHQFLYTGVGDERRCHFCQLTVQELPEEQMEDYLGQAYFHEHNENIKKAELNWRKK